MNRFFPLGLLAVTFATANVQAQTPDVVHLANLKFAHYGAVSYLKESCGKYGLKVEERFFAKGADVLPAIVSGDIDVAALAGEGGISGRANGVPIYAVAGFASGGARIVVGADSGIRSLRDLKGRKVGVTRSGVHELLLYAELEKAGLSWSERPGKDVQIVFLSYTDLNQALAAKQIDAMAQTEPQASESIDRKFGVELLKPYDTAVGVPERVLVMAEKMYRDRPDVAQRFMTCFVETTLQFRNDPALAERYVRDTMFKGQLSAEEFRAAMSNAAYIYDLRAGYLDATAALMNKYGLGRMAQTPKAVDWVRLDLLQKAKATLQVK